MSDSRRPQGPGDAPPFVLSTMMSAAVRAQEIIRALAHRLGRRVLLMIWGIGTVAIFLGLLVLSIAQAPDWGAIASGIFGSFFAALLFAGGMGWFLIWLLRNPPAPDLTEAPRAAELETLLSPTLRELDAARAEVISKVRERSRLRLPGGVLGAVVFWFIARMGDDPPGGIELIVWAVLGALAGEIWAIGKLDRDFRRLYKERVLPQLARRFGDLTYQHASHRDVVKLKTHRVLADFDHIKAEDEISGTHHGMPVSIVEARLEVRSGKNRRVVFDGLLIELELPRNLTGTTVIMPDGGMIGNLGARWRSDGLERVSLEDPAFEKLYEVYSSDQIEARALLTPAFMQRFAGLATLTGLAPPGATAEGNRLTTALPKRMPRDLFEPPPYWKASGGRELLALSEDIAAVLKMVDAVIEVDFFAAGKLH